MGKATEKITGAIKSLFSSVDTKDDIEENTIIDDADQVLLKSMQKKRKKEN